ncbi:MAG TPA: acyl-CoA dehydrogenase family protein, partial [Desulfatirhabdiaceae bacterium]|nr:acyl-CoA dehydrogenase family protein [Desulfatirhabdiaceae bacterium]
VVRMAAAAAYIDEIAYRLDSGETDLQVEGAIAKVFATETANRAADDAMQALGGYGYITEFGVEKIKRDVKVTCIYEGTSEIQQNILSTFRWKKTWKSKGRFYLSMAEEMDNLCREFSNIGCRFYAQSARTLNQLIILAHEKRLTREQYVMFLLADMMTYTEVGIALARKTACLTRNQDAQAEIYQIHSRLFAAETADLIAKNSMKIAMGTGTVVESDMVEFMKTINYASLVAAVENSIVDMDMAAKHIFKKAS